MNYKSQFEVYHLGQLVTNDRLVDQALAKDLALVGPLEAFFNSKAGTHRTTRQHDPAFVVEVGQNDHQTGVFDAEQVLNRHLDLILVK